MIFSLLKNKKGFSLIEILVAFVIITTSIVAIFSLVVQNIQVQKVNKDFLVASMLAQEGLELVRSIRDENWLDLANPGTWDGIDDTDDTFSVDYNYTIDRTPNVVSDGGAQLYFDTNKFYTHNSTAPNVATQFYRMIKIDDATAPTYISVSSHVQWKVNGVTKNYIAETLLYDWR